MLALVACAGTTTTAAYTPVTGIYIRADSLVSDYGCGTNPGQVYKYAAVVYDDAKSVRGSGLYSCFADGLFANLIGTTTSNFTLQVYAFDYSRYSAQQTRIDAAVTAVDGNGLLTPDTTTLQQLHTYGTDCVATQQSGVQVLAVCKPLR